MWTTRNVNSFEREIRVRCFNQWDDTQVGDPPLVKEEKSGSLISKLDLDNTGFSWMCECVMA